MSFSRSQQVALAITPKVTSIFSLLGSGWIVVEVLTQKQKRENVYNRLLCALSIFDMICASWFFASSWPIPEGTEGVAFAIGNERICTVQGFIIQFSIVPPIYNACLSVYYLLVVSYGVSESSLVYIEPLFHLIPISFGLGTSGTGLALDLFNNANLWCWIAPYPPGCEDSRRYGETTCTRGDNAWIYRWAFYYGPLWFCILFVTVVMVSVYLSIRRREVKAIRESTEITAPPRRQDGRASSFMLSAGGGAGNNKFRRSSFMVGQAACAKKSSKMVIPKEMAQRIQSLASIQSAGSTRSGKSQKIHSVASIQSGASIRYGKDAEPMTNSERSAARHVLETLETFTTAQHQNLEANQFGSRAVFRQSMLYTLAFYATFLFATVNRLLQQLTGKTFFTINFLHSFFIPLQGLFNVMVYRYAYYFRLKHRNPHMTNWELMVHTWRWSVFGPSKGKRKSVVQTETDTINAPQRAANTGPVVPPAAGENPTPRQIPNGGETGEGSDSGSVLEDLRGFGRADDGMGEPGNDPIYGMVSDLMVTYSDFPNVLADEAVMVSTDYFPTMLTDDFAFAPHENAPHAFPTPMPAFPTIISEEMPAE